MTARYGHSSVALQARQLRCERDDRVLFDGLDVQVHNGDLLQLAGPNGAGKTTLLRLLAGLNRDYSGDLLWHGQDLYADFPAYAAQRLYQGHLAAIKKALTPLENLRWLVSSWSVPDDALWTALDEVELGGYEETPCQQLSAGQQRRVALARLCIAPAPLWILDEPFTALDKAGVQWLEGKLQQQVEAGGAVVITSHHALENIGNLQRLELGSHKV
ncbi:cytochrome c biogenesis heme-transporting ATPase CcmA [Venatoribacter cucullus]|uniref:Cytochrome c biogenesis heme-transporting ATPase CcmA n=1 Tax=Venatoribacter cucullus TaxID=2661630 RepID=A0A9X7UVV1_9GAMM|nr:cytochrome c biogenesis heme-transporting ATPase CcmA [Venatoribacter cucullus]QQD24602.1 cytochrome c biogenesis heme-transporting ATPase CcmA [Venatoribacter cucullus]